MFTRIDRLQIDMPIPKDPDPRAAAAVQELVGGCFRGCKASGMPPGA